MFKKSLKEVLSEQLPLCQEASPFPHAVIDNLFDDKLLEAVMESFNRAEVEQKLNNTAKSTELKFSSGRGDQAQNITCKSFLRFLNSTEFIDFIQSLTGIRESLIPDPHFIGGGLHLIKKGGYLKVHADFAKHIETDLDRRVNLLIYLNQDWDDSYGGNFEMWDKSVERCVKSIEPIFNRTVIFNTTDYTYHGHPTPLVCPENRSRKSIAIYYYSNGRPDHERRSTEKGRSTLFVERPGETFGVIKERRIRDIVYLMLKEVSPPVIFKQLKRVRRQLIK